MEEYQRRRVARADVDDVEFDPGRKTHPPLLEIANHGPLLWFLFETNLAGIVTTGKWALPGRASLRFKVRVRSALGWGAD